MKVIVEQLKSSHDRLRTKSFEATLVGEPKVGEPLVFFSDPLDPGKCIRYITTSKVVSIEGNVYETENSTYKIDEYKEYIGELSCYFNCKKLPR